MNHTAGSSANGGESAAERVQESSRTAPVTEQLAARAHDTVERVAGKAEQAERQIRDAASRTAEQARELHGQASEVADEQVQKVRSFVQQNPLVATGIAFAAGVVLSAILRR